MELRNHDSMNGMKHINRPANRLNRLMKWPLLCGLLGLALANAASAQQWLYDNENYFAPAPQSVPTIDATNFLNNSTFIINWAPSFTGQPRLFQTRDTLNYTNNGLMIGNNGFNFDTYSSSNSWVTAYHSMASSFNNGGTIRCGAQADGFSVDGFPPEFIVS